MIKIENHYLTTIIEVVDSEGSHQWRLRLVGTGY